MWLYHASENIVHSFSIGAVTNCHKLGDLRAHKLTLLQFWMPEIWISVPGPKPRHLQHGASSKDSSRDSISFPVSRAVFLDFFSFFFLPVFLGSWPLRLQNPKYIQIFLFLLKSSHYVFSSLCVKTPSVYKITCGGFRTHLNNPG